jgi:hypothetical protein
LSSLVGFKRPSIDRRPKNDSHGIVNVPTVWATPPDGVTITLPVCAPTGTVTVMAVALQFAASVGDASTFAPDAPVNVTVPIDEPNCVP